MVQGEQGYGCSRMCGNEQWWEGGRALVLRDRAGDFTLRALGSHRMF